jgi:hypothetical protein
MIARLLLWGVLLFASAGARAAAQVEAGVHGSVNPSLISGEATLGAGGRAGAYLFATGDVDWKVDGVFDYFFASCPGFNCWAWQGEVNVLATRKLGEPILGYGGFGAAYQRVRLVSSDGGDLNATSDHTGVSLVIGAQLPAVRFARPFVEARFGIFDGIENQLVFSLGMLFGTGATAEDD